MGLVGCALYFFVPPFAHSGPMFNVLGASSAIAILVGVRLNRTQHKLPWYLFSAGLLLLAYLHGEAVGVGALKNHPGEPCEIKRMWVSPGARGLGVGRRLLERLEAEARRNGAEIAHIETNHNLTEAIALYRSAGYAEVRRFNDEPFADHWFEKPL